MARTVLHVVLEDPDSLDHTFLILFLFLSHPVRKYLATRPASLANWALEYLDWMNSLLAEHASDFS